MRLTLAEVNGKYNGTLPPGATLLDDDDDELATPTAGPKRRTRSERFAAFNAFVDYTLSKLTNAESKVWFILFRDVKGTGIARTGEADLARRAGLSERMVRYAVKALTEKGLLTVVRRGRLNSGPSAYRVHPTGNA